jgi:hypothetical protein
MAIKISKDVIQVISNLTDISVEEIQETLQSNQEDGGLFDELDEFDSPEDLMPYYHKESDNGSELKTAVIRRIIAIAIGRK